jgi:hypothetical protein
MKFTIHIGVHKTGTTAIQGFCHRHRDKILVRGALYPAVHVDRFAQHPLAWCLGDLSKPQRNYELTAEGILADFRIEAGHHDVEHILISSEALEAIHAEDVLALAGLLTNDEVRIIVYLRRQDDALLSIYSQRIKSRKRFSGTLRQLAATLNRRLNYWDLTERWANAFGKEAMRVRLYDPSAFPSKNIIPDFMTAIGLDPNGMPWETWRSNPSPHPITIEAMRQMNEYPMKSKARRELMQKIDNEVARLDKSVQFISTEERKAFLHSFDKTNTMVARTYFDHADGVLFSEPPDAQKERIEDQQELIRSLIARFVPELAA